MFDPHKIGPKNHATAWTTAAARPADPSLPRPASRWVARTFGWYGRRYLAKHFRAVRKSVGSWSGELAAGPVVVALSHGSWWDPLVAMVVADAWPERQHYAAMDAAALERYRLFRKLGFFAVDPESPRGARRLWRVGRELFERPRTMVWLTPQGRFQDARQRPLGLRPGIGLLARQMRAGSVLPIAIEYPFWTERLPEALVHVGSPLSIEEGTRQGAREWTALIEQRLTATQDELAALSIGRDVGQFVPLVEGRRGVGWAYDLWRRVRAWVSGQPFRLDHGDRSVVRAERAGTSGLVAAPSGARAIEASR